MLAWKEVFFSELQQGKKMWNKNLNHFAEVRENINKLIIQKLGETEL